MSAVLWDWLRIVDVGRQRREELAETLYFERPSLMTKVASWAVRDPRRTRRHSSRSWPSSWDAGWA
ncbi:hypothetical protein [Tessaracoccus lacteus]|uniref:Uncharacterized protein n=1 Tax=Tessaracoccus lacteus TaxID=3041766 RepID=A0ABY8PX47_9ACTN|nr:hypothetical protein [Tessaracoccus sp. T21]WGT46973.1 hypothetical protein QH948_12715 [Tessaracoccus sp. T21]